MTDASREDLRNLPPAILSGMLILHQVYDVGYAIDIEHAHVLIAEPAVQRRSPVQIRQASSIEVAVLPLRLDLGSATIALGGLTLSGTLRATIYDLAAIVVAFEAALPNPTAWDTIAILLADWQDPPPAVLVPFRAALEHIVEQIRPAITRPEYSAVVEDYSIIAIDQLATAMSCADLAAHPLVLAALLGERRPLSPVATQLITSQSYFPDDLALLSWNGALLIDPEPLARATTTDLIEYANVELVLLRSYDTAIDRDLLRLYQRIATARSRFRLPLVRPYSQLLHDLQQLVVEVTEVTERVDNALKVTDDVYWNRLYSAILQVLRVQTWRQGVDHKLALLRETYEMLHHNADAERSTALEWVIILLIVFEILMALVGHG